VKSLTLGITLLLSLSLQARIVTIEVSSYNKKECQEGGVVEYINDINKALRDIEINGEIKFTCTVLEDTAIKGKFITKISPGKIKLEIDANLGELDCSDRADLKLVRLTKFKTYNIHKKSFSELHKIGVVTDIFVKDTHYSSLKASTFKCK